MEFTMDRPVLKKCIDCKRRYFGYRNSKKCPECTYTHAKRRDPASFTCKHLDCMYRDDAIGGTLFFCGYILRERESRGCSVNECNRYMSAIKKEVE